MSDKWVTLANLLVSKTEAEKLDWQETSDDDIFQVVVGKNAIEVEQMGFETGFEFRIRDGSGKVIDRFTTDDLENRTGANYQRVFHDLFLLVRRRLSGSEQVLDEILSSLRNQN